MSTSYTAGEIWLVVLAAGLGTFALRLSFVLLFGRVDEVPDRVVGLLRFVPAAVLAALVAPAFLALSADPASAPVAVSRLGLGLDFETPKLVAGAVAALVAWRTENVLATIGVGMVALWVVQALG
ncbi:AzlD domain-containing protein [Halobium salinum]|uniref:AzlD domain-containing protein n=1 Tax=Halobium salinum TaxID=1364940 RepID=A0ABD5PGM2_9EURY|nr:AzlD domain-containing protein [Halobium salinum]